MENVTAINHNRA